jgi:hypothetical protein
VSALEFGKAAIRLSLLSDDIEKQLNSFQARLEKFGKKFISVGKSFSLVGGAIIAPFAAGLKSLVDFSGQLNGISKRTGISIESLQGLGFAAEQSGGSLDAVGNAALGMGTLLLMASRGNKKATTTLKELGVSLQDLEGLSPAEKFVKLADAVSKIEDPLRQAALAEKVFGGAGVELLPLFKKGAGGINELIQKSAELGPALSAADTAGASKFKHGLSELWDTVKRLSMQLGLAVVGPMTSFVNLVQPIVAAIAWWIHNNQTLFTWIAAVGAVLVGIGSVLLTTGTLILFSAKAINVAKLAVSGITSAVKGLSVAVAFLCDNPLIALIAAIAGVILYVLYATGALGKLFHWMGKLVGITDDATDSADGFNDALKKVQTPDIDFDKLKGGLDLDATAKLGTDNAKQLDSFFDPKLVRQTIGADSIQTAQLSELKGIKQAIKSQKVALPVK